MIVNRVSIYIYTNTTCGFLFVNLILSGVVLKPVMLHSNFDQFQLLYQGAALRRVTFGSMTYCIRFIRVHLPPIRP